MNIKCTNILNRSAEFHLLNQSTQTRSHYFRTKIDIGIPLRNRSSFDFAPKKVK